MFSANMLTILMVLCQQS